MPNTLLLHPTTSHQHQALLRSLPQAILVSGPAGAGKRTVAKTFTDVISDKQFILEISPEEGVITIDTIRKIKDFLRRKTTGKSEIRRMVVIYEAESMPTEAQNALLKVLEEPPADTVFVLTTSDIQNLKPTIRSRTQRLVVVPVALESALEHFKKAGHSTQDIEKAYHISRGNVGLLHALLEDAQDHELVKAIDEAKNILKLDSYNRLLRVEQLSKDKTELSLLLEGLERVAGSGLKLAGQQNDKPRLRQFYRIAEKVQQAKNELSVNANTKLVLTKLFMDM